MKIINKKKLEDCKDGSLKFQLTFSSDIDKGFINSFSDIAEITIREDFDIPYFKVDKKDFFALKGSLNNNNAKLWINNGSFDNWKNMIKKYIEC